ncbi:MAG: hypothetical protein KDK48_00060 [Chlamydiia bacterium]|nr:hypothetical protein [Chlamydiia bacterium]
MHKPLIFSGSIYGEQVNSTNLYQYCFNNPYKYKDPHGQFVFALAIPIGVMITEALVADAFITAFTCAVCAYATYETAMFVDSRMNSFRTDPQNLWEQLALDEAKGKGGDDEIMKDRIGDPRYPSKDWKKRSHNHEHPDGSSSEIHWWENRHTGEKHGFKFKDYL